MIKNAVCALTLSWFLLGCTGSSGDKNSPDNSGGAIGAIIDVDTSSNQVTLGSVAVGSPVGITAAIQNDGANTSIVYQLIDDAEARFSIDKRSGVVLVADFSRFNTSINPSHLITVVAISGDSTMSSADFVIQVIDRGNTDDITPPAAPSNLRATVRSSTQIDLTWAEPMDDVGVVGYRIYRDNVAVHQTDQTNYSDSQLSAQTLYRYSVAAYDAANNMSSLSQSVEATTVAGEPDNEDGNEEDSKNSQIVTISTGSDDGYSWGHYGDDWEDDDVDLAFIRFGGANNAGRDYIASFMFRDIRIAAGQNILSAKLVFSEHEDGHDNGQLALNIKPLDPVFQESFAVSSMGQDQLILSHSVAWNKSSNSWESPDLSSLVQAVVNEPSWSSGKAMGFVISNSNDAQGDIRHTVYSSDAGLEGKAPKLVLTYGKDLIPPVLSLKKPSGVLSAKTTSTQLSVTTNEVATCRYSHKASVDYTNMAQNLLSSNGLVHQAVLSNLQAGKTYAYYVRCTDSSNPNTRDYLITFSVASMTDAIVALSIDEPAGVSRVDQNVRTGVPIPKGLVQVADPLILLKGSRTQPLQTRPLSVWDDGSIRWLLLDTQVSLGAGESEHLELKFASTTTAQQEAIGVSETDDLILVDTGPLQFSVPKKNAGVIHSASLGRTVLIEAPKTEPSKDTAPDRGPWVSLGDDHFYGRLLKNNSVAAASDPIKRYENYIDTQWGTPFNHTGLWDLSVTIEEQGDLHVVVRISGTHLNALGEAYSSFVTRVHAYQGDSKLRFEHTFIFTGTGNDKITGYGLRLPFAGSSTLIEGHSATSGGVTHLEYDTFDVNGTSQLGQALGYVAKSDGVATMTVALNDMAQNFPKSLVVSSSGVDVQLYPLSAPALNVERYSSLIDTANSESGGILMNRSAQGISKTDVFEVKFDLGGLNPSSAKDMARALNAGPLLALADANWYSDSRVMGIGAFAFASDLADSPINYRIDRKLHVLADFMRFNQREQFDWFGMMNYGDIRGKFSGGCSNNTNDCVWSTLGRYGWSGNSGEPSNQLWVQFLRKPSREVFRDAVALTRHTQDLQMIHYGDATQHADESISGGRNREFSVGSLHRHGVQPWSGYGQQPEYSHVSGLETYYYLSGDARAKEALFEAAAFMTRYSVNKPSDTAMVNGIDTLSRASAVFFDEPEHAKRFSDRLELLISDAYLSTPNAVVRELSDNTLNGAFNYFVRGANGLLYHHERTGDQRMAEMIFDAADIITQGGDKWGVGTSGVAGSVWYYLNSLSYAATIAANYGRSATPYTDLVSRVLGHNTHTLPQEGSVALSLQSLAAIPDDWKDWVWAWNESDLNPSSPALLHISRQLTFRNDFMQDYHSYRAFIHLSTSAALLSDQ